MDIPLNEFVALEIIGEFIPNDTLSEFSRELSLYKYAVITIFYWLRFRIGLCVEW
jgi:hypothetical protein